MGAGSQQKQNSGAAWLERWGWDKMAYTAAGGVFTKRLSPFLFLAILRQEEVDAEASSRPTGLSNLVLKLLNVVDDAHSLSTRLYLRRRPAQTS